MGIKIGRLDFKAHGLLGTAGLVLLGAALCCSTETARYLIMASIPVTTGLACLLYTSPSPRDATLSRMPSSA